MKISKIRILVSDANQKHTLGIVRTLGKNAHYEVDVFCASKKPITSYSKFVRNSHWLPDFTDPSFVTAFTNLVKEQDYDVYFPVGSRAFEFAVHNSQFLENELNLRLLIPRYDQFEIAMSKEATRAFASQIGLQTPKTHRLTKLKDLQSLRSSLSYPVVIKAQREMGINVVDYAANYDELQLKYHKQVEAHQFEETELPIIQDYIRGHGEGYFALCFEGQILSEFQHRRIREYPPTGGMSTCAISTHNENVRKAGSSLLKSLKWTGVAMVEFKVSENNEPYLLEINPKYWGSHDLALESNIDFPNLALSLLLDGQKPSPQPYKIGVKYCWPLHGDLQHALMKPTQILHVMIDMMNPKVKSNLWVRNDIAPTFAMVPNLLSKLFNRIFQSNPS